jgi:MoaA/NifB/PqqE/SkfB family radical SAM enzyme
MPTPISLMKKAYDLLGNDYARASALQIAGFLGIRKDVVRINTNDGCNIRCIFCASHQMSTGSKIIMSMEHFKTVIDKFAPTTRILYLASEFEPLVTRDFHRYIEYACRSGIPVISYPTNGLKMNQDIIRTMVDNQMTEIVYSMQGYRKQDYDRISYGSNFDKVIVGLESLAVYKRKKKSRFPLIRINTILLASNLRNFSYLRELVEKYDVKTVQFRALLETPGQNNPEAVEKEKISNIEVDELEELSKKIKVQTGELSGKGIDVILPGGLANGRSINPVFVSRHKNSCSIPQFSIWIDHVGEVRICPNVDNPAVGNAITDPLKDIRRNMKRLRRLALLGKCKQVSCMINMDTSQLVN